MHYSADQFAKHLYPHMLNTDGVFVGRLKREYQGWLVKDARDWINSKM